MSSPEKSSPNEHERKCRKRKPVTCQYCADCKSNSLFRMHDSFISPSNSNYETDKEVPNDLMGDDVHTNNGSSETRCQDVKPFGYENKRGLKVFKKEPADDDCPVKQESRVHDDDDDDIDGAKSVFNCGECVRTFGSEYRLLMHVSSVHGIKEESPTNFICEECGKLFAREFTLRVHSVCVHEGGTCGTGNELIETSKLQLREVADEKYELFKCNECGAIIKTKWNFRRHLVKSHNDEKPFRCAKCGKTFKQRHHLRAHYKKELHHLASVEPGVRSVSTLVRCKVEENPSESVASEKRRKKLSPSDGGKTYFKGWSVTGGEDIDKKPSISEVHIHGASSSTLVPVNNATNAAVTVKVEGGKSPTSLNSDDVTSQIWEVNVCPPCGKSFDEYEKLIEHAKICAKYAMLVKRERRRASEMGLTKREYGCSVCGSTFSHATDINAHLAEVHDTKFFFHKCAKYPCGEKFRF